MRDQFDFGYTLVEIILAIAILGIVLVPVLTFMSNSSGLITYADIRERAIFLAQQRIEEIKSLEYDNINSTLNESKNQLTLLEYPEVDLDRYPDFFRGINILGENLDSDTSTYEINTISITIEWNGKSITLKNKVAKR